MRTTISAEAVSDRPAARINPVSSVLIMLKKMHADGQSSPQAGEQIGRLELAARRHVTGYCRNLSITKIWKRRCNCMRRRSLVVLTVHSLCCGTPSIVGRWRSVTTTRGGIGAVYDFQANGKAAYSSAAIVETDFRLSGNQLTLGEVPVGIGWHPDGRLQFNHGNGELENFTREGKPVDAERPLLGEWTGNRMMEGRRIPVTMQFQAGDRALLVIYLRTVLGRYQPGTAPNGKWTVTLPPLPARVVDLDTSSGQLTITASGGDPYQFSRF
jgi:hypothetical protein